MNVLIIGKYPPIQGGESTKTYWLARGLGRRGHNVSVISNCYEVENQYRCQIPRKGAYKLQPHNVELISTQPKSTPFFIPQYNPYPEKLLSLAFEKTSKSEIDFILGWYLVPFGGVAATTARMNGISYGVQHAGSDIERLFKNPVFRPYLERVVKGANIVFAYPQMTEFFKKQGCKAVFTHCPAIPDEFNPNGHYLDFKNEFGLDVEKEKTALFLGKINRGKGLECLLSAFQNLSDDYNLLVVGDGKLKEKYVSFAQRNNIENAHFIKPLPPWMIPDLLRSVRTVVVPENDFGVTLHKSRIPLEALCSGNVVVTSSEISSSYGALSKYLIDADVTCTKEFAQTLKRSFIDDESARIKASNKEIRKILPGFDKYISEVENCINSVIARV